MSKVPMGKRRIHVRIDEDVYDKLVNLIRKKFMNLYGALSFEVQEAIAHWISEHEESLDMHTNTHKLVNPMMPRSHVNARKIMTELRSKGFILQCSMKDLRRAIEQTRGSDERTIKKWTKFLVDNGYMKFVTHRILEIV